MAEAMNKLEILVGQSLVLRAKDEIAGEGLIDNIHFEQLRNSCALPFLALSAAKSNARREFHVLWKSG